MRTKYWRVVRTAKSLQGAQEEVFVADTSDFTMEEFKMETNAELEEFRIPSVGYLSEIKSVRDRLDYFAESDPDTVIRVAILSILPDSTAARAVDDWSRVEASATSDLNEASGEVVASDYGINLYRVAPELE